MSNLHTVPLTQAEHSQKKCYETRTLYMTVTFPVITANIIRRARLHSQTEKDRQTAERFTVSCQKHLLTEKKNPSIIDEIT